MIRIIEVDYTYAETCNGEIRVHKDLYDYDIELYNHAIKHELAHQNKTIYQDLMLDLNDLFNVRIHLKALLFYFKHPKIIIRMISPVNFNFKGGLIEVNWVLVTLYVIYVLAILFVFYF